MTHKQRESLLHEVFYKMTIEGKMITGMEPKPVYAPWFAAIVQKDFVGYSDVDPPPSPPETHQKASDCLVGGFFVCSNIKSFGYPLVLLGSAPKLILR